MIPARDYDVVGLGEALIEFNQTVPGQSAYRQGIGGDTSNAVIAAARAGARTAYLGRYGGNDDFGELLLQVWRDEGVDVSGMLCDEQANNGLYFVRHTVEGHSFSYVRRQSAAARMQPADLRHGLIERARFLHVSGISLAISVSACDTVFPTFPVRIPRVLAIRSSNCFPVENTRFPVTHNFDIISPLCETHAK